MGYKFWILPISLLAASEGAFAARSCDSGYTQSDLLLIDTFTKPTNGSCPAEYTLTDIPETVMYGNYDGFLMGSEIKLCTNGYSPNGTSCKTLSRGSCDSGYVYPAYLQETFTADDGNGACTSSEFEYANMPDTMYWLFNGYIMGDAITLCTNGYSTNGSSCATYGAGSCNSGYYDLSVDSGTFSELTDGSCSTPYSLYTGTTRCDHNPGDTCVDIATPVVTLTFSDGTGNTTTGTCLYDDVITLPPQPTRPGYTFNGWVVQSTSND